MIVNPNWVAKPTGEEIARFYPEAAGQARVGGRAVIECSVQASGAVTDCNVLKEDPPGFGFGEAAVKLSALFQMRPKKIDGVPEGGARVTVPIQFVPPEPSDLIKELETDAVGLAFKRTLPADWEALHGKMVAARQAGAADAQLEAIGDAFFESFQARIEPAILKAPASAIRTFIQALQDSAADECTGSPRGGADNQTTSGMTKAEEAMLGAMFAIVAGAERDPTSYGPMTDADKAAFAAAFQRLGGMSEAGAPGTDAGGDAAARVKACDDRIGTATLLALPPDVLGRIWSDGIGKSFSGGFPGRK